MVCLTMINLLFNVTNSVICVIKLKFLCAYNQNGEIFIRVLKWLNVLFFNKGFR